MSPSIFGKRRRQKQFNTEEYRVCVGGEVREVMENALRKMKTTKRTVGQFSGHFIFQKTFFFRPPNRFCVFEKRFFRLSVLWFSFSPRHFPSPHGLPPSSSILLPNMLDFEKLLFFSELK